jgi:type III secretion protein T
MNGLQSLGDLVLGIALILPRIAAAFIVLPAFTNESMPPLVRNSFFVSLSVVALPFASPGDAGGALQPVFWPLIMVKEAFIGLAIGFMFGIVFWAIGNAGNLIDTKIGATTASVMDHIAGHQTSLTGSFLSRLASWLFMASGGFLVFLDLLLSSYAVWPVNSSLPKLTSGGELMFTQGFSRLMLWTIVFAAPALLVLSLVELALGLVNRFAQQLNVFSLSLSIKSWLGTWLVLLSLGTFVEFVLQRLSDSRGLLELLKQAM